MKSPKFRFRHFYNAGHKRWRGMALYVEGWKEVANRGFHAPVERSNLSLKDHYTIIIQDVTHGETDIGIVAYFRNEMVPDEIVVNMFYIKPEYRGKGLSKKLFTAFRDKCVDNGFSNITFGVHRDNTRMRKVMEKAGCQCEFITYELKLPDQQDLFPSVDYYV
jgi:GNAT superfamily N-acetyltransferase